MVETTKVGVLRGGSDLEVVVKKTREGLAIHLHQFRPESITSALTYAWLVALVQAVGS